MEHGEQTAGTRKPRSGSGISLPTLIIASAASAAASFAVSRVWGPGTLISAAATPIIVAIVSEFLRRPVHTVTATAKRVPVVQKRSIGGESAAGGSSTPGLPRPRTPAEATPTLSPLVDPGAVAYAESNRWRPHWSVAFATGVVAFAIVVGVYTVPDILAGRSITGSGKSTTFFGGATHTTTQTTTVKTVIEKAPATAPTDTSTVTVTTTETATSAVPPPTTVTQAPAGPSGPSGPTAETAPPPSVTSTTP